MMTIPAPRTAPDDWSLVERAQSGDSSAFAAIYAEHQPRVFRFVEYRTGDRWLAEDITADTFVRCLRHIGGVTWQGRNIGAWLITIARNLITDHYKSGRVRMSVLTGEPWEFDRPADDDPEGEVLRVEREQSLRAHLLPALADLTDDQRRVVELRFFDEMSVADAAVVLDRSPAATKTLQHRATSHLRRDRLVIALGAE